MKIEYDQLKQIINDALLKHHKQEFIGMALIRNTSITLYNQEEWDKKLNNFLDQISHNVVRSLKQTFKEELVIIEEGTEVMNDIEE